MKKYIVKSDMGLEEEYPNLEAAKKSAKFLSGMTNRKNIKIIERSMTDKEIAYENQ